MTEDVNIGVQAFFQALRIALFQRSQQAFHLLSEASLSRLRRNIPVLLLFFKGGFYAGNHRAGCSGLFIFLFIKVLMTPMKLIFKLLLNTGCGFVCLFLLNLLSGFTGIVFELNFITAAIVGFLGLPGIILLLVFQFFL